MTVTRRKHTVAEFRRAYEVGVFAPDERLELLLGEIYVMEPIRHRDMVMVNRLNDLFQQNLRRQVIVSVRNPLVLSPADLPRPDIALLGWRDDLYAGKEAAGSDAVLVVEVADSTVASDRTIKLPLYAAAGVPEVWIVNLREDVAEIHRKPEAGTYGEARTVPFGAAFAPLAFPECSQTWLDG